MQIQFVPKLGAEQHRVQLDSFHADFEPSARSIARFLHARYTGSFEHHLCFAAAALQFVILFPTRECQMTHGVLRATGVNKP